tara:strand:+ start:175 stop:774 length:600 start_codon:yes stop_codon:yes gene_type:complete
MSLTNNEQKVLNIIEYFISEKGHSPTYDEIAQAMGLSNRSSVVRYVKNLQEKNHLRIPEGKRKSIEIIGQQLTLPLIGTVAAGQPLEAYEVLQNIDIHSLIEAPNQYLLEVSGESMIDAGIIDGDLVLIKKQEIARNGQIVVALIDNREATLKEIQMNTNDTVSLIPHNMDLKTQIYPMDRVSVQGVYQGARFDKTFLH